MKLPSSMSYEQATFIEPLATVIRGFRTMELKPDDSVLILGTGLIGLMHIKLARALGAGNIVATDVHDYRLDAAIEYGAQNALNVSNFGEEEFVETLRSKNQGRLYDKVINCTGALSAAKLALSAVGKGGSVMFFAVPKPGEDIKVNINEFWRDSKRILVSYGAAPVDNKEALGLIRVGNLAGHFIVDDMITHRLSLEEIAKGFRLASTGEEDCLKVIIEPNR